MQKVAQGVYRLSGLIVGNVYLLEDADGLTLIDASIAPSGAKILRQVGELGRPLSDVKRILITHAHPDHVGSLPALKRATNAQVVASAAEKPVIEGRMEVPRAPRAQLRGVARLLVPPATKYAGTPVDRVVEDGELLPEVLGGMQVVATPGHAPGHLAFWQPARRLLFCGDVLFNAPNLRLPFAFLTVDMAENVRSVGRLAALEAEVVCFGHGRPLTQNSAQTLRDTAGRVGRNDYSAESSSIRPISSHCVRCVGRIPPRTRPRGVAISI